MRTSYNLRSGRGRAVLLACTAMVPFLSTAAHAQTVDQPAGPSSAPPPAPSTGAPSPDPAPGAIEQGVPAPAGSTPAADNGSDPGGLQEIVVTAQRREQRLQDVPIAITALSADTLSANRVTSVADLSGLAPGFVSRPSAGGSGIATFSMRGVTSYGVVPGSDKEISIYLDGVYVGASRGSLFELPDIQRIEVLRGPQGTLFGRNATAGALSIVTRDPTGEFHVRQDVTVGNYDQLRTRTTVDLPQFGPFKAYVSYVHDERDGDIRNAGAGTVWDRTGPQTGVGVQTSPKRLGDRNLESVFAAVKFEPSDTFRTTYKFDYAENDFTPEGQGLIGYNPAYPLIGGYLQALFTSQPANGPYGPILFNSDARRPKVVNNSFATPGRQVNEGHSLISELNLTDNLTLKNTAAYRRITLNSASQISGAGGLVFTPQALVPYATFVAFSSVPGLASATPAVQGATIGRFAQALSPLVGGRAIISDTNNQARGTQWSDELQANYDSDLLSLTVGGIYFHSKDRVGGPRGITNTFSFRVFPASGRIPLGGEGISRNKTTSIAAYAQAEIHVTPQIDAVLGGRITRDKKTGSFSSGGVFTPGPNGFVDGTITGQTVSSFDYRKTKPNYSVGLNYKPTGDILLYAKYSTGFVSGGSIGGVDWDPETVKSAEGGIKADFLDRRLRTNLSVYTAKYNNIQSAQGGQNVGRPELSTVIIDGFDNRTRGVELEISALPVRGLTLSASGGYQDTKLTNINPILLATSGVGPGQPATVYNQTLNPKFTYNLSAQYESEPLFDEATLYLRADAVGRSYLRFLPNPAVQATIPTFANFESPASWVVNGRVALRNIAIGPVKAEVAGWVRNLTQNRQLNFPLSFLTFLASGQYQPARTYGLDLSISF